MTVIVKVKGFVVITGVIVFVIEVVGLNVREGDNVFVAKFVEGNGEGVTVIVALRYAVEEKMVLVTL